MNRFYKNRGYLRKATLWSKNSGYAGKRSGSRKTKLLIALVFLVVVVVLFQCKVFSFAVIKDGIVHVTSAAQNAFSDGKDWASAKLGLNDNDLLLPVSSGVVVEDYGVVRNEKGEECYHGGVDIKVPQGSEVLAAENGEITAVDTHDDQSIWVTVKHSGDWSTVYGRLGTAKVAVGDEVKKGDVLGTPQKETLHFEVLENGTQKNPVDYFQSKN